MKPTDSTIGRLPVLALTMILSLSTWAIQERVSTSVMTYNIHIQGSEEEMMDWDQRRSMVAQVIRLRSPEILGIQGATFEQSDWLSQQLKDYAVHTPEATETELGSDICPIFFDRTKYRAIGQGSLDLDDLSSSVLMNWVELERIGAGKVIYVFNTHLEAAQCQNAALMTRLESQIRNIAGDDTFVFVGDLDQAPDSPFIQGIASWAKDSLGSSLVNISEREETHCGWKISNSGQRLDYVFLSEDIPANSYEVLDVAFRDQYPSDHLPVFCRLRLDAPDMKSAVKP